MAIIYAEGDCPLADAFAKQISEYLVAAYPNHSWWVECRQGALIIKHFEVSGARGTIGMVKHLSQLSGDAERCKHDVIVAAGELLERAGLIRGGRTDDPVKHLELDRQLRRHWHAPNQTKIIH